MCVHSHAHVFMPEVSRERQGVKYGFIPIWDQEFGFFCTPKQERTEGGEALLTWKCQHHRGGMLNKHRL